ncbi:DedA family protein [Peribacillus deserti]|uniref:Alkaline phosphatase n=1 Tax=Peribacillus deserti TaxID=673318 RepID=A0A2N5M6I0_9BACI|nr:DedA family protein [Peribacillus deserti]PLT29978.1 alkaline phosphatase [Peribacillus deserti]
MENWITEFMSHYGYFGVFLLIALENIFPPIPSEVILTFGGFMTTTTELSVTGVILASTFGSVAGAAALYGAGYLLKVERLEAIVRKWGRFLRLKTDDIHRANAWFDKYGAWTVLFCRLIPLIRSLISIPAGISKMNFWVFLLFTTAGTLIWNTILVNVGAAFGSSWEDIVGYMDTYSSVTYIILAVMVIVIFIFFIRKRSK